VRFALSAEGRAIIERNGLVPIVPVVKSGEVPADVME